MHTVDCFASATASESTIASHFIFKLPVGFCIIRVRLRWSVYRVVLTQTTTAQHLNFGSHSLLHYTFCTLIPVPDTPKTLIKHSAGQGKRCNESVYILHALSVPATMHHLFHSPHSTGTQRMVHGATKQ